MSQKGFVRVPNPVTEDILAVIARMSDQEVFGPREVRSHLGHRSRKQITAVLSYKARRGALERVGRGQYRKGGTRIKTQLPLGLVAEAVWAVLFTRQDEHLLRLAQIAGEVESYIGRPQYSAYHQVAPILSRWHQDGHLERTGEKGEYAYRLKPGITERPVCSKKD